MSILIVHYIYIYIYIYFLLFILSKMHMKHGLVYNTLSDRCKLWCSPNNDTPVTCVLNYSFRQYRIWNTLFLIKCVSFREKFMGSIFPFMQEVAKTHS